MCNASVLTQSVSQTNTNTTGMIQITKETKYNINVCTQYSSKNN